MSVRIKRALCVEVHKGGFRLHKSSLSWVIGNENKLTCRFQLDTLLSHCSSCTHVLPIVHFVATLECCLNGLCERKRKSEEYENIKLCSDWFYLKKNFHCCLLLSVGTAL